MASACAVASIAPYPMTFDFDTVIERRGTDSQKWQKYAGRDVMPLWVADMDFKSPPAIIAALQERVATGLFGYARPVPVNYSQLRNPRTASYRNSSTVASP